MKMREDYAVARFDDLEDDVREWRASLMHLQRRYSAQRAFGGMALQHFDRFMGSPYLEASRMENNHARYGDPMLEWKWKHNPGPEEDALPWTAPDYDDADWPVKHVVRDTWSTIGHHNTITDEPSGRSGRMAYRVTQRLGALPGGKRAYLWIGSTDGSAKLFVNGRHVPYIVPEATRRHAAGETIDRFYGVGAPAKFDVTDVLAEGENQFTILAERYNLNELGTGGIMGPVVLYRER